MIFKRTYEIQLWAKPPASNEYLQASFYRSALQGIGTGILFNAVGLGRGTLKPVILHFLWLKQLLQKLLDHL